MTNPTPLAPRASTANMTADRPVQARPNRPFVILPPSAPGRAEPAAASPLHDVAVAADRTSKGLDCREGVTPSVITPSLGASISLPPLVGAVGRRNVASTADRRPACNGLAHHPT